MSSSLEISKDLTVGQIAAILNKVSGGDKEKLEALLRDEYRVSLIKRAIKFFDKNGRRIPSVGLQAAVCDARKDLYLNKPELDYVNRLIRFTEAFKVGHVLSWEDFYEKHKKLFKEVISNKNLDNLLKGVYFPIILPKLYNFTDYSKTLKEVFIPAVKLSYERQFPGREFHNCFKDESSFKIDIVPGSRHEKLIEKMKKNYVVALYFPNSLQGFSISASREQMSSLPESLILAGGFDSFSAMVMYPDILARDYDVPDYDLSALSWNSRPLSLCSDPIRRTSTIYFTDWSDEAAAYSLRSSGLLFIGS